MTESNRYEPPKVWTWDSESGGRFAAINRPVSGATHDKDLPIGEHPLQLYSLGTPNGVKVTLMLEELLELGIRDAEYDAWPINILSGDQFSSGFVAVNPNSKIPALLDRSGESPIRIFESGAILVHLAEKFGHLLPAEADARAEVMSWLFWLQGSAPFLGVGFGHFYAYAPEKWQYPIPAVIIRSQTLPPGPGMAPLPRAYSMRLANSLMSRAIAMCSAGPKKLASDPRPNEEF